MKLNLESLDISWRVTVAIVGFLAFLVFSASKGKALVDLPHQLQVHDSTSAARDLQKETLKELKKINCYNLADHTHGNWRTCEGDR